MTPIEFEDYLVSLSDDQYEALVQERIARLNPEQQKIAQARETQRKEMGVLLKNLSNSNTTEEMHQATQDYLRNVNVDVCEHGRSYCKHCVACGEIDHIMFPELFNQDGERLYGEND